MTTQTRLSIANLVRSLPIPIYAVRRDGTFLFANGQFRDLFSLPHNSRLVGRTITEFYADKALRQNLLDQVDAASVAGALPTPLQAKLLTRYGPLVYEILCLPLKESKSLSIDGFFGCLLRLADSPEFDQFLTSESASLLVVDSDGVILKAAAKAAEILGRRGPEEIEGRHINKIVPGLDFQKNPSTENSSFVLQLDLPGHHERFVQVTYQYLIDRANGLSGGDAQALVNINDVTELERYSVIDDALAVGHYVIKIINGIETVVWCNKSFARMLDLKSREQAIGKAIKELHGKGEHFERFRYKLQEKAQEGAVRFSVTGPIVTIAKEEKIVEAYGQWLRDPNGAVIGRVGALRDRTEDTSWVAAQAFRGDFASLLHGYSTHLFQLQSLVRGIKDVMRIGLEGEERFDTSYSLRPQLLRLRDALNSLLRLPDITKLSEISRRLTVSRSALDRILAANGEPTCESNPEVMPLADGLRSVAATLPRIVPSALKRSLVREATILQLYALEPELELVEAAVGDLDFVLRSSREFIFFGHASEDPVEELDLTELLHQVVAELRSFAKARAVRLQVDAIESAPAKARKREIIRALGNLLHNAIKYSWRRPREGDRWVSCRAGTESLDRGPTLSYCEFENYGVGIPPDELKNDLLFRPGTRGRWSTDRGRVGTGLGLPDARRVARRYDGDVVVNSYPLSTASTAVTASTPHLTSARFWLPYSTRRGHRGL